MIHKRSAVHAQLATALLAAALLLFCAGCRRAEAEPVRHTLTASWTYSYRGIEEMAQVADLIAVVSITGRDDPEQVTTYPTTYFDATVSRAFYGTEEAQTIRISMTGGIVDGEIYEITDDPLMEVGDTYLIFAKGGSGNYRILTGSQGRFLVDPEDGTVSSVLNLMYLEACEELAVEDAAYAEEEARQRWGPDDLSRYPVGADLDALSDYLAAEVDRRVEAELAQAEQTAEPESE